MGTEFWFAFLFGFCVSSLIGMGTSACDAVIWRCRSKLADQGVKRG